MKLSFVFNVLPVAKERPRFSSRGATYTAPKTRAFENLIATLARLQMKTQPLVEPLTASVTFEFKKPKKTKLHSPGKDIDNLLKSVLDSLNGIVYADDKQVWDIRGIKKWSDQDRITLELEVRDQ